MAINSVTERGIANANEATTLPWTFSTGVGLLEQGSFDDLTRARPGRGSSSNPTTRQRSRSRARSVRREGAQSVEALPRQPAESSVPAPPRPHEGVSAEPRQPKVPRQPPEAAAPSAPRPREASRERSPGDHSPALGDLLDPVVQSRMRRLASATEKSGDLRVQRGHRNFFVDKGELENFVGWTNDQQNDFAMSVEIDLPHSESEWKRILKCPMKFTAKSVNKGAEVSWAKLNETQRRAMRHKGER